MRLEPVKTDGPQRTVRMRDTSGQDAQIAARPRRRVGIWLVFGVVVTVAAIALVWPAAARFFSSQASVSVDRLRIGTVVRGPFVRDVAIQGTVVAAVAPTLYAPTAGTVTLHVHAGDTVSKDQLLAELYSPALDNELSQERATLQSLEIGLARQDIEARRQKLRNRQTIDLARVSVTAAERELQRARLAWEKGVIKRQDLERASDERDKTNVEFEHATQNATLEDETLDFELATLRLERDRQTLSVQNLERRVAELSLRSPVDGIVGNLAVEQRAAVVANTPVVTVVDLTALQVEVRIPENYADDLAVGLDAEIRYAGKDFAGVLTSVAPEVRDNSVLGRVRFAAGFPGGLRQNQRVSARVILDSRDSTLTLERGPFLDSGGGRVAYVVADAKAQRRAIRVGASSVSQVEILEGLRVGDRVVISGSERFDGADTILLTE